MVRARRVVPTDVDPAMARLWTPHRRKRRRRRRHAGSCRRLVGRRLLRRERWCV